MIFYCTYCWKELRQTDSQCPYCGALLEQNHEDNYTAMLIRSLHHPDPTVPIRVAEILAERKETEALPELKKFVEKERDPFKMAAFLKAIYLIEGDDSLSFINHFITGEASFIVREAVFNLLKTKKKSN